MQKFLYYFPRAIAVLITLFFTIFIAEGFGPEFGWQDSAAHALLALAILAITVFAWKKPKIGGWIFILIGAAYLVMVVGDGYWNGVFLGSIPLVTGILFLIVGAKNKDGVIIK